MSLELNHGLEGSETLEIKAINLKVDLGNQLFLLLFRGGKIIYVEKASLERSISFKLLRIYVASSFLKRLTKLASS